MLDTVGAFANLLTALAAAFAAWFAWKSLTVWRDEQIGRRKAELAEEVLADFYQASDAISSIRFPFSYPSIESAEREKDEHESESQKMALDALYVPIARLDKYSSFFANLFAKRYRMKALFGPSSQAPFESLNQVVNEISHAASMRIRVAKRGRPAKPEMHERWNAILEGGEESPDEIETRIESTVRQMEEICGPVLESRVR